MIKKMALLLTLLFLLTIGCNGCEDDDEKKDPDIGLNDVVTDDIADDIANDINDVAPGAIQVSFDFRDGQQAWVPGIADYSPGMEDTIDFIAENRTLPEELEREGTSFYVEGRNISDDIFMYIRRRLGPIDGIEPDTAYDLNYRIVFASDAPSGCFGIGGAPGESVWVKVGGAGIEPETVLVDDYFQMNVDIGNQSQGGENASVVSDVANGIPCEDVDAFEDAPWVALEHDHLHDHPITSSPEGELWLLVGQDSGFEGVNTLFFLEVDVTLTPR